MDGHFQSFKLLTRLVRSVFKPLALFELHREGMNKYEGAQVVVHIEPLGSMKLH